MHVDSVIRAAEKQIVPPAPCAYEKPKTFGKVGLHKSFGVPDNYEEVRLKRQSQMPGPGNYKFPDQLESSPEYRRKFNNTQLTSGSESMRYSYTINSRNPNPMT